MRGSEDGAGPVLPATRTSIPQVDLGPDLRCSTAPGDPLVLTLTGRLSGQGVRRLHAALLDLDPAQAQQLTAADVVLDLAGVDAVDLEGLHLLVRLDAALEARGHTLRLRQPTRALLHVVAGAGLLAVLPLSTP